MKQFKLIVGLVMEMAGLVIVIVTVLLWVWQQMMTMITTVCWILEMPIL